MQGVPQCRYIEVRSKLRCKEVVKKIVGMLLSGAHSPIVQFSSAEHRIYIYDSSVEHKSLFHIKLRGAGTKLNVEEEEINISSEEHNCYY